MHQHGANPHRFLELPQFRGGSGLTLNPHRWLPCSAPASTSAALAVRPLASTTTGSAVSCPGASGNTCGCAHQVSRTRPEAARSTRICGPGRLLWEAQLPARGKQSEHEGSN